MSASEEDPVDLAIAGLNAIDENTSKEDIEELILDARELSALMVETFEESLQKDDYELKYFIETIKRLNDYSSTESVEDREKLIDQASNEIMTIQERPEFGLLLKGFVLATLGFRQSEALNEKINDGIVEYIAIQKNPAEYIKRLTDDVIATRRNIPLASTKAIILLLAIKSNSNDPQEQDIAERLIKLNIKSKLTTEQKAKEIESLQLLIATLPENHAKQGFTAAINATIAQNFYNQSKSKVKAAELAKAFSEAVEDQMATQLNSAGDFIVRLEEMLRKGGDPSVSHAQKNMVIHYGETINNALDTLLQAYRKHNTEFTIDVDLVNMILDVKDGIIGALDVAKQRWQLDKNPIEESVSSDITDSASEASDFSEDSGNENESGNSRTSKPRKSKY